MKKQEAVRLGRLLVAGVNEHGHPGVGVSLQARLESETGSTLWFDDDSFALGFGWALMLAGGAVRGEMRDELLEWLGEVEDALGDEVAAGVRS